VGGRRAAKRPRVSGDDPVGAVARDAIAYYLQALQRQTAAARAGRVEGVHQLRVATRRLRAALALFESALPRRAAKYASEELAWLGHTTGPVRDLDVLAAAVAKQGRRLMADGAPATVLMRHVREQRAAAHAILVDALDAPRMRRLVGRLTALAGSATPKGAGTPCRTAAPALIRPLIRSVRRAGRGLEEDASAEELHVLRVRAKRLRYALGSLDGLGGAKMQTLTKRLTELQELLGEQRDAVSQRVWLRAEAGAFAGEPETLLAIGALCEILRRRARRLARRVPAARDRVTRRKLVAAVLRELGAPTEFRHAA